MIHPLLVFFGVSLVLLQVSGDTDNRLSLCGNACIRVARGDGTLTPAQIDARISLASSNHKQCSVRCTALYQQGDTLDSLVDKLAQIPFEELFRDQK